jgi:anti-anti-sigma factor
MVNLDIDSTNGIIKARVAGNILSTNVQDLRKSILDYFESSAVSSVAWKILDLDLSAAQMIDSTGLNFLVALSKYTRQRPAELWITISSPNIRKSFSFIRLDRQAKVTLLS